MPEETISHPPISGSIRQERGARWLACFAATVALTASLWAALAGSECGECHASRALLQGIPIAWAGVAYYAAIAFATGWRGLTDWSRAGFFAAIGAHAVLVSLLVRQHIFCGACFMAASAATIGAAVSLFHHRRALRWAALPFALATAITFAGIMVARVHTSPLKPSATTTTELLDLPDGTTATRPSGGRVKLVLYEREGCKHCLQFDEEILPRIQEALGTSLEIEHREATPDMETPTIVVVGKGSTTFTGVPVYEDLERAAQGLR